jgi:RNA polymerase sigma-70 factor (ECF subfamily)
VLQKGGIMLTDDEMLLLTKAASGDAQAFEMLVQEHQARIYGLCLRMMGNPDDAMDAV